MAKLKSKHHIYTITLGNKKPYIAIVFLAAFALAWVGTRFVPVQSSDGYMLFLKKCIGEVFVSVTPAELKLPFKNPITAYSVMSGVSPIFTNQASPVPNSKKAADTPDLPAVSATPPPKRVISKAIVSRGLEIKNETDYDINPQSMSEEKRTYMAVGDEPKVLIIHTHASETYSSQNGTGLGKDGAYRTTDTDKNMVMIGEIMASHLKENGINTIHDQTLCDYPSYNSSYVKSLEVIESYLAKYPSIEFVFDIHRDAIAAEDGTPTKLTCKINGEETAQAMIVCGTDAMGLENPNWRENLILALKIQKNLENSYPGFMRPVNIRRERFNMHKTKGSLLFEVGTHGNTLEEAKRAVKILADGIARTIGK